MAKEQRLIDANAALKKMQNWNTKERLINCVEDAPTVDAVPVVRCKDCKYCRTFYPIKEIDKEAIQVWYCDLYRCNRKPDEFCSDGERK